MKMRIWIQGVLWMVLMVKAAGLQARPDGENFVADDLQLVGKLGPNIRIELQLNTDLGAPFFSNGGTECFEVEGQYYYRTQLKPIAVQGSVCPAKASFSLETLPQLELGERFEGKVDFVGRRLFGTWLQAKAGKSLSFEVAAVQNSFTEAQIQLFYAFIDDQLAGQEFTDAEGAKISEAKWSSGRGEIIGFEPAWNGGVDHFSPVRFAYSTYYTSTARSSSYDNFFQLLPSKDGTYVLSCYHAYHYDKTELEISEEKRNTCYYNFALYKLEEDNFEEMIRTVWPEGISNGQDLEGNAKCSFELLSDGVLLPGGKKVWWNGSAFLTSY